MENNSSTPENKENVRKLKRQQLESPMSAASPMTRKGHEQKKILTADSPLSSRNARNNADANLDETEFESFLSKPGTNLSYELRNVADGNLDQTAFETTIADHSNEQSDSSVEIFKNDTAVNNESLRTLEEVNEDEGDVTLSAVNTDAICLEDIGSETRELTEKSTLSEEVDDIQSVSTSATPKKSFAPVAVVRKPLSPIRSSSPPARKLVDESLCEFLVLEQQVAHDEVIENYRKDLENCLKTLADRDNTIEQMKESRKTEEEIMLAQVNTLNSKLKDCRQREQVLREANEEVQTRLVNAVEETEKLFTDHKNRESELKAENDELRVRLAEIQQQEQKSDDFDVNKLSEIDEKHKQECSQLESVIEQLERQLHSTEKGFNMLKTESDKMEDGLRAAEEKTRELTAEMNNLQLQSADNNLLEEIRSEKNRLEAEVQQLLTQLNATNEELNSLKTTAAGNEELLVNERSRFESVIKNQETQLRELEQGSSALRATSQEVEESLRSEITSLKDAAGLRFLETDEKYKQECTQLENVIEQLEKQLRSTEKEFNMLKTASDVMDNDLRAAEEKSRQLTAEMENLQLQSADNNLLEEIRSEKIRLEAVTEQLQTKLSAANEELNSLKTTAAGNEELFVNERSRFESVIQNLEKQLRESEQASSVLQTASQEVEDNLRAELTSFKESANAKLSEVEKKYTQECSQLESVIEQIERQLHSTEKGFNLLKTISDEMEDGLRAAEEKTRQLTSELECVQKHAIDNNLLEEVRAENNRLEGEMEQLQGRWNAADEELNSLKTTAAENEELLVNERSRFESETQNLETQLRELEQASSALRTTSQEVEESLRSEITSLKDAAGLRFLETDEKYKQECTQLENVIEQLEKQLRSTEKEFNMLKTASDEMENDLRSSAEKTSQLTAEMENLRKQSIDSSLLEEVRSEKIRLEEETEQLQTKLSAANEELNSLKTTAAGNEELLVNERSRFDSVIQNLETQLRESEQASSLLQATFDEKLLNSQAKIDQLTAEMESLQAHSVHLTLLEEVQSEKQQLQNELAETHEQLNSVTEQIISLKSTSEDVDIKLSAAEEKFAEERSKLENSIAKLENQLLSYQAELEISKKVKEEAEQKLKESESKKELYELELNLLKSRSSEWQSVTESLAGMREQMDMLRADLATANQKVVETEENAQHDVTIMKEEVEEKDAVVNALKIEVASLKQTLQEMEDSYRRAKNEVERLEKVCDGFDDDERKLKDRIEELEQELALAKGVKPKPEAPGLLQLARQGIKPLSRDATYVEPEHVFEDAQESFNETEMVEKNKSTVKASRQNDKSIVNNHTMVHPDDADASMSTPSKANSSKCHQQ